MTERLLDVTTVLDESRTIHFECLIHVTLVYTFTQLAGNNSQEFVMYTNENVDASVNSMVRHHFHLHHGEFVRVEVTATNRADSSTGATSDGLKIDLTEPKMSQLVDGRDLSNDIQFTVITNVLCTENKSIRLIS